MINGTLFRREWKANWLLLVIILGVLTMYAAVIILMFDPKLGESLRIMSAAMPALFDAFGMGNVGLTLFDFIEGYLYGMLLVVFPAVYIILLSGRLVVRYVDNGSMAYLLASPHRRREIVTTQAVFLCGSLLVMVLYVTVMILGLSELMFPGELAVGEFLQVNVGLFGVLVFQAGICFLPSCLFNDSRQANGISTSIIVYSILVQMLGRMGDKFSFLTYLTPLSLFDAKGLAAGNIQSWMGCGVLYVVGIGLLAAGIAVFSRRNIPV